MQDDKPISNTLDIVGIPMAEWWAMPENERVIAVLRAVGVDVLGNFEGCACCNFKVRNVEIEISCGKGQERGIWILSWSQTSNIDLLRPIAEEVARQVEESDGCGLVPINIGECPWKLLRRRPQ